MEIVGVEKNILLNHGLYSINVNKTLGEVNKTDVIVIPLLCGDFSKAIQANKKYRGWVTSQYHDGAEIVCLSIHAPGGIPT